MIDWFSHVSSLHFSQFYNAKKPINNFIPFASNTARESTCFSEIKTYFAMFFSNLRLPIMFSSRSFKFTTFGNFNIVLSEAVLQRCSVKMVFLEISQNSQENTCAKVSFLIKLLA